MVAYSNLSSSTASQLIKVFQGLFSIWCIGFMSQVLIELMFCQCPLVVLWSTVEMSVRGLHLVMYQFRLRLTLRGVSQNGATASDSQDIGREHGEDTSSKEDPDRQVSLLYGHSVDRSLNPKA